jgi:hypothetical protein
MSSVPLCLIALVVLARAGVLGRSPIPAAWLAPATWVIGGLFALDTLGNLAARSRFERYVFGGATVVLTVLCAAIAFPGTGPG